MSNKLELSINAMQDRLIKAKASGYFRPELHVHGELGAMILTQPVDEHENTGWLQYYNIGTQSVDFRGSTKNLDDYIDSIKHVRDNLERIESTTASYIADGFNSIVANQSPCMLNIQSKEFKLLHDAALRSEFRADRVYFYDNGSYWISFRDSAYDDIYECPLVEYVNHSPVSFDITM